MDTDLESAESLAEKELVLRRMTTAKVDDDGTSLSAANAKNLETSRRHHNSAEETEEQIRTRGRSG